MGQYIYKDCLDELDKVKLAKLNIKNAIEDKGVEVPDNTPLADYPDKIAEISGGVTPEGTIEITLNGTYDVTDYASAEVNVRDTPDYRNMNGQADREGLAAIGWTTDDILRYEQNAPAHYAWQNDQYLLTEENKNLFQLDDPNPSLYKDDPLVTFVPNKNMESYFAKSYAFKEMKYIKGIPQFNTGNVTSMEQMFEKCNSLTSIPLLDTSNVTNMGYMFNTCEALTSIPQLDTSNVTNMRYMFSGCKLLTTIPLLDTSNVTNMSSVFNNCYALTSIPQLDTSKVTNMPRMFNGCNSLTSIPQLDTSKVTDMNSTFSSCSKLTTIPQLDTSKVTDMTSMLSYCTSLISIPQLDTSKVTGMSRIFQSVDSLTTVEGIDFSGLTSSLTNLFGTSSTRPKITRFIVNGKINVSISDNYGIKALTAIDYDSVKSILEAANRTDNTNSKTLAFTRTISDPDGELAALVASCASKGWSITGLTLN